MGSRYSFSSVDEIRFDPKWLIDPQHLFVGPRIGEGAHAKVYEGKYKNQNVAIKIVNRGDTPEEIAKREARFMREVATWSRVQHKNLAKFIGACKEPIMVIVTEILTGGSLRKYMLNKRPDSLDLHVAVENLVLTKDQRTLKLVDFGLAREETVTEMMTAETGTYRWMAPELYSTVTLRQGEKKHYNQKVDAYSFAIVFWELLHNRLPFEGMSNLQAAYAAAFKNVRPSLESLPEDLAMILSSCWMEDPDGRPNFSQIIQMLLNCFSTILPSKPVVASRLFTAENAPMSPESPGTSALMAVCNYTGDTPRGEMEHKPKGFFFCFNQCY
ncbi:hypothetical protein E3N88_21104 [Mikania micrantha]|uniref:Protein kinase domain-containing protein n=1 Tax=Mikania micrantha TaxID=192012 RepID=A0A5N6NIX3_9ASTR|nr:hypothetical protein E3N88_21104 [Mikania micrantha]